MMYNGLKIRQKINKVIRFADDQAILRNSERVLQRKFNRQNKSDEEYERKMN